MRCRSRFFRSLPVAGALLLAPHGSARWGVLGHRVVARIAETRLTVPARAEVRALLHGGTLVDVAMWADSIRPHRRTTAPWHYVNVPITDSVFDRASVCPDPPGCVVSAIERFQSRLADRTLPAQDRAEALRFLVHLIGDLHQPLHAGDDHDRGGNSVLVTYLGRTTNLHALWDSGLLEARGLREEPFTAALLEEMRTIDLDSLAQGTVEAWTMASHDRARDFAYPVPGNGFLTPAYGASRAPLIDRALIEGGIRLAAVLNAALAPAP